ncbi:hypothetical protein [Microlunatus speluncae]|uniref:hypothetical protein n=1 Tax=Microlunatus speluncae TaxID=2594267 RepID=UPI0012668635|nr:hypothetical protein [Microlunatus speluncae]
MTEYGDATIGVRVRVRDETRIEPTAFISDTGQILAGLGVGWHNELRLVPGSLDDIDRLIDGLQALRGQWVALEEEQAWDQHPTLLDDLPLARAS